MIPIALSGDRTYNKDNIRRYIMEGGRVIPGASTVHFDEISKKRIFASVDNANFSDIKLIKENYTNLKNKLGRIPHLRDFDDYADQLLRNADEIAYLPERMNKRFEKKRETLLRNIPDTQVRKEVYKILELDK